jgi:putative Holliday junction resolvase
VERALIAQDVSRARRAKVIDQHAAAFILQGALDRLRRQMMDEVGQKD